MIHSFARFHIGLALLVLVEIAVILSIFFRVAP